MANNVSHGSAVRDVLAAAITTAVGASGKVVLKTAGAVVVVSCPMAATPFGSPSSGVITAGTITTGTVAGGAGGTVTNFEVQNGSSVKIYGGTVGVTGCDLNITNTALADGDTVPISSLTYTAPA